MVRKKPSLAGRAFLAVVLMIGFYVLALGICVALGLMIYVDLQSGGRIHPQLWIIAGVTIGIVLWSVWPRKAEFPDPGLPLDKLEQPRLWQMIEQVASDAGQEPPRQIFLVPEINAFVAERNSRLGFGGERIMGIGLPLLQVLSVPQLKAVIAHEFGHFHGGDTRLGPLVYRTREAIGRTVLNFQKADSYMHKPFEWYGKMFLRATFAISRAQEFAADALSVQLVGLEPVQSALRRVNEVGPLYDHYLENEYFPMLNRGVRPPLAAGFEMYLGSAVIQKLQVDLGEQAMQSKGNPYDSHPPLPERLAAAAEVEDPGPEGKDGPASITLLDDPALTEGPLLAFVTGRDDVLEIPAAAWRETGNALAKGWRELVAEHGRKLPAVIAADLPNQQDQLELLALAVDKSIPTEHRRDAGVWFLGMFLANALGREGFAVETGPGEPIVLTRGDARIEPFAVTRMIADGKFDAGAWRKLCAEQQLGQLVLAGPDLPAGGDSPAPT